MTKLVQKYWQLTIITLGAGLIRLHNLTAISLWHDEAFSALLINYSWNEMLQRIIADVHPPLYYWILKIWHYFFGSSLWSLRGFSALFGVICVWLAYLLARKIFGDKNLSLWIAVLVAINPFLIQYSSEARMYTFGSALLLAVALHLVWLLKKHKHIIERVWQPAKWNSVLIANYGLFGLGLTALCLTHYYLIFSSAALFIYALYFHAKNFALKKQNSKYLIFAFAVSTISIAGWLPSFFMQNSRVAGGYWIPQFAWKNFPETIYALILNFAAPGKIALVAISALFAWCLWLFCKKKAETEKWLYLLIVFMTPIGVLAHFAVAKLNGSGQTIFLARYFIFITPFLISLIAAGLWAIRLKIVPKTVFVLLILLSLISASYYWHQIDYKNNRGMAAAAKYLNANFQANDKIITGSTFVTFNLRYYNRTGLDPKIYSAGIESIAQIPHFAGTALMNDSDLLPSLNNIEPSESSVWLVWTNAFGANKPSVPTNWMQAYEAKFEEVKPYSETEIFVTQYKVQ